MRKLTLFLLLFSGMASAQVYTSSAFQNSPGNYGRAVPFAQVTLCASTDTAIPCTQKVQTFTSDTLLTQCTLTAASGVLTGAPTSGTNCNNPGIADAQGNFTIYVAPGNYRICLYSQTWFCAEIQVGGGGTSAGTANCGNATIGSIAGWSTPVTICFDPLSGTDFAGNLFFQGARALGANTGFFGLTGNGTDPTLSDSNTVWDLAPLGTFTSYGNRRANNNGTAGQFPYIASQATINGLPVNTWGWSTGTGGISSITATSPVVVTPSPIVSTGIISLSAAATRRVCMMGFGANNGSALANADIFPQISRRCYIPYAATIVEIMVTADAGTPSFLVAKNHLGSDTNLTSSALATAASGGRACSNTGGTTSLDGSTTCTNTLTTTAIVAGDILETTGGVAGGTAKSGSVAITWTVN